MPSIQMHLHKVIPSGGGLGGGSADAAFALMLLNEMYGLNLSKELLLKFAMQLGSDCPFFIVNKPCFSKGRGELLEQIQLDLSAFKFIIVNSGLHVNTGAMFREIKPAVPRTKPAFRPLGWPTCFACPTATACTTPSAPKTAPTTTKAAGRA